MTAEAPILLLSQDYELFFQDSGSIEKCLFEPCDALLGFAKSDNVKFTFYVDAGMLLAMDRCSGEDRQLAGMLAKVRRHIESLAAAGHEIALHVHPHWEDTRRIAGRWQFQETRYQLREFAGTDIAGIFMRYSACLADLCGEMPASYRAGGFCVEPFAELAGALSEVGISVDSSVVPGAILQDGDKGFDFRAAPDEGWWNFDDSPSLPSADGQFLEIPITPQRLPQFYYWGRLAARLGVDKTSQQFGDGTSKAIGRREVLRRLATISRAAELSIDDAKAQHLLENRITAKRRKIWHLMGHPKLASARSIEILRQFIRKLGIDKSETVSALASRIRSGEL